MPSDYLHEEINYEDALKILFTERHSLYEYKEKAMGSESSV